MKPETILTMVKQDQVELRRELEDRKAERIEQKELRRKAQIKNNNFRALLKSVGVA